jgi:CHAT domain-containing protein
VLSACQTSVGNVEAENGFAGLALKAGVPSAIGTLWLVSDVATMSLMNDFYGALASSPTKAEALREAQLAMLRGQVRIQGGNLRTRSGEIALPRELAATTTGDLSAPYYWAGFSLLSNPW